MGRRYFGCLAAVVACAALMVVPASALAAGSYTWTQPGDFTATGSGSNPETKYGAASWSYPGSFQFSGSFTGAGQSLAGWSDKPSAPTTWIAVPAGGSPSALQMVPPKAGSVALTWRAPVSGTVDVSGTVSEPNQFTGVLSSCGTTWQLLDNTTPVPGANGSTGGPITPTSPVVVSAGDKLVLTVADSSTGLINPYTAKCDETNVTLLLSVTAVTPTVSVTSPTNGATITSESFTGTGSTGFGDSSQVTVDVCSGTVSSCPAGSAIQTMTPTVQGDGSWTVAPGVQLPNGSYTVQAEQNDLAGDSGLSDAIPFTLNNSTPPPTVTLSSLGSAPLTFGTPTLTGTAGTATGDSGVQVRIFSGSSVSGAAVRTLNTSVNAAGGWSVQVTPALANGTYTAIAGQVGPGGILGLSSPVTFTVQVTVPTGQLTLNQPVAGTSLSQSQLMFAGSAATGAGDSSTVTVTVWKGGSASGTPLGTTTASASSGTWSTTWPHQLALGLYTVQASQATATGTATTTPHTFLIVPTTGVIGSTVQLSHTRTVTVSISCPAPSGEVCAGTVLVVTAKSFQPTPGGPKGAIRLMFAYVSIRSGQTVVIRRSVSRAVWRTLHHKSKLKLHVTATMSQSGATPVATTATRTLKIK